MEPIKINYPIMGYAPGNYQNKCSTCKQLFMGDKMAVQCDPCAVNMLKEQSEKLAAQLQKEKQRRKSAERLIEVIAFNVEYSLIMRDDPINKRILTDIENWKKLKDKAGES